MYLEKVLDRAREQLQVLGRENVLGRGSSEWTQGPEVTVPGGLRGEDPVWPAQISWGSVGDLQAAVGLWLLLREVKGTQFAFHCHVKIAM